MYYNIGDIHDSAKISSSLCLGIYVSFEVRSLRSMWKSYFSTLPIAWVYRNNIKIDHKFVSYVETSKSSINIVKQTQSAVIAFLDIKWVSLLFFFYFFFSFCVHVGRVFPKSNGTPIPCSSKIILKLMRWDHCEHASSNLMLSTINDRLLCNKIIGYDIETVEQPKTNETFIHIPYAWHSVSSKQMSASESKFVNGIWCLLLFGKPLNEVMSFVVRKLTHIQWFSVRVHVMRAKFLVHCKLWHKNTLNSIQQKTNVPSPEN